MNDWKVNRAQKRRNWFSPRGARRGFMLASIALALWCAWAIGYQQSQGLKQDPKQPVRVVNPKPFA
jgi:hypothetical protein